MRSKNDVRRKEHVTSVVPTIGESRDRICVNANRTAFTVNFSCPGIGGHPASLGDSVIVDPRVRVPARGRRYNDLGRFLFFTLWTIIFEDSCSFGDDFSYYLL